MILSIALGAISAFLFGVSLFLTAGFGARVQSGESTPHDAKPVLVLILTLSFFAWLTAFLA